MAIKIGGTTVINDTGGIVFPDGGGSGSSVATNTLSDFEEGSWLPLFADAGTGGNTEISPFSRRGTYVRIGNTVTVWGTSENVEFGGGITAADTIYVQGLPFEAKSLSSPNELYIGTAYLTYAGATPPIPYILDNTSWVRFIVPTTTFGTLLDFGDLTSLSTDFHYTITYQTSI